MTSATRDGSALCSSCGLCCNGTIFDTAPLDEADVAGARRLHLPVHQEGDRFHFDLPCPRQEDDGRCGVYEERPGICRTFQCRVLLAYLAGEMELPAGLALVERLRALATAVTAQLPPRLLGYGLWRAATRFSEEGESAPDPAAWRAQNGDALFDILELERLLRRDFVDKKR